MRYFCPDIQCTGISFRAFPAIDDPAADSLMDVLFRRGIHVAEIFEAFPRQL